MLEWLAQSNYSNNQAIRQSDNQKALKTNDLHIELPASKSLSNRWLVLNYLTGSPFVLRNLSTADDTLLLQALLNQLRHGTSNHFYCHNAGSVARFLLAVLAITPGQWLLSGDDRLKQRPFSPLIDALRNMGCRIECTEHEGCLPVRITGYMPQHKMAELDPSASSQFVSAMLLIGPMLPQGLTLTLTDRPASRPYIDMTCTVLNQAGIETSVSPNRRVYRAGTLPSMSHNRNLAVTIERDWSSASYIYAVAALLPGLRIRMPGLSLSNSCQGDRVTAQIFEHLGVTTREVRSPYRKQVRSITVCGTGKPDSTLEYNFLDCPDLLPAVVVTCAALGVRTRLRGIKNLRIKESDRIQALKEELEKMGGNLTQTATEIRLAPSTLHPTVPVSTHGDHRIAMAFGVLTLLYPDLVIEEPEQVSKSFPDFWTQLNAIRNNKETLRLLQASKQ